MKANISRWFILLLALVCVAQAVSAFEVIKEDIKADGASLESGQNLEPGQEVNARYIISYRMATTGSNYMNDETFEFSTGLEKPYWIFKILPEGRDDTTALPTRGGRYQSLGEFELGYSGEVKLDVQLVGTVPTTSSGKLEVFKLEHFLDKSVEDEYHRTLDVVTSAQVQGSLSAQQQRLKDLKANMDEKSAQGVDISAVQTEYNAASQALASAAAAGPAEAAGYISTATKALDKAEVLLDKAWAEKEVSNAGAAIETLDEMITYFVEERSMKSDAQVVAIITKRESAVQFYTQAQDSLNAANYSQARSKASDALSKANDALADANALKEKIGEGFNLGNLLGGNLLLYIGIGIVIILGIVGVVLYRRKTRWDELG